MSAARHRDEIARWAERAEAPDWIKRYAARLEKQAKRRPRIQRERQRVELTADFLGYENATHYRYAARLVK